MDDGEPLYHSIQYIATEAQCTVCTKHNKNTQSATFINLGQYNFLHKYIVELIEAYCVYAMTMEPKLMY